MAVKLVNAYVLVEHHVPKNQTASGLYLPDTGLLKSQTGTVVAVGRAFFDNGTQMEFDVKPGDTVMFKNTDGLPMTVEGKELLALSFAQIIGVLT